jgi:crotonobetainyl-CoA:carnitine CoA-transferase CaiB-like acyl-CoA transferase
LPFPVKFIAEEIPEPAMAPTLGEHTDKVLAEVLEYDADTIAALRKAGALG